MKDSIHKYFQIGTIQWMSHPAAEYKVFDALEVTQMKDSSVREAARRLLEQAHMRICYGAQPRLLGSGLNPNDLEEDGRQRAEQTLLEQWMRLNIWEQTELHSWPENGRKKVKKRPIYNY